MGRLYKRSGDWDMDFNVAKCYSMTVTLKRNSITNEYHISDVPLEKVQSDKYLGVYI